MARPARQSLAQHNLSQRAPVHLPMQCNRRALAMLFKTQVESRDRPCRIADVIHGHPSAQPFKAFAPFE